jgi:hypothetical protein
VVTLLDLKEPLLDPPPVLEPPLLEPLEPSLPLPDQLEMLDPLLVEVDLDLLLLLRCWSSLPLDLSVGSCKIFPPFLKFIASFFCLASANCVGSQLEMLDPLLVEVDLDLWQLRGRFTLEFECNIYCQKLSDALLKGFLPDHASINILTVTTFVRHLFRIYYMYLNVIKFTL